MRTPLGLLLPVFIILIFSLSTIWSTTPSLAINQLTFILFSFLVAIVISKRSTQSILTSSQLAYVLGIVLLISTFVLGQVTRGAVRWISIGPFNLQTSEVAKPLIILAFAHFFTTPINKPINWLVTRILLILPVIVLVLLQPDLGSAIIISMIWFGMLLGSSLPRRHLFGFVLLGLLVLPLGYELLQPYQKARLTTFVNPYADPSGSGYNVIQSQIAIGSGQIMGKGIRQGTQSQLRFLPERHTDFAFASFAEEFGFVGSFILVMSLVAILFWLADRGSRFNNFAQILVIGVFWMFFTQSIVNIGMNLGIMPVTGITLPLFSYGGSSLLSFGIALGLVLSTTEKTD